MYTGQIISGAGHGVLILWLLLGDFLFSPPEPEELSVTSGTIISSADFEAMQAAARANVATAPEPVVEEVPEPVVEEVPPEPVVEEVPEPVVEEPVEPVVEEPPEPVVEEVPPEPEEIPEGTTGFAEPSALPPSDEPQPLPTPLSEARPRQRPSDIMAAVPVEETLDVEVSDAPTPAVSEEVTQEPVVEQEPVEETAPEAASTEIIPEQLEPVEEPTLAPTSSPRPRARPTQVAAAEPEEVVEPVADDPPADQPLAEDPPTDQPVADPLADIVGDVVNEEPVEEPTDGGGTTRSLGESLNSAEINGLKNKLSACWDLGAASTAALNATVTLLVTMGPNGEVSDLEVLDSTGDSAEGIATAERSAKRAVIDCGRDGLGLPPEKYETWKEFEVYFDPRGAQLR